MTALTPLQSHQLDQLEDRIQKGLSSFVDVGNALVEIRDLKLYRNDYATFEDYCRTRWGLGQSRAYQMIDAAKVVANIESSTIVEPPANEAQTRPLARLDPEQQREAWQRAVESAPEGRVTAAHVERAAEAVAPRKPVEPAPAPPSVVAPQAASLPDPPPEVEDVEDEPLAPARPFDTVTTVTAVVVPPVEPAPEPARDKHAVHFSSATDEHWTPEEVWQAAIEVMGAIDLDPCSNSATEPNVPAKYHYTRLIDGLTQPWEGRVYMNPPYGREISAWAEKLVAELDAKRLTEAIALVPARTDTQWWKALNDFPFCLVEGRLTFVNNDDPAPFPSAIFYIGPNVDKFCQVFESFGDTFRKMLRGMDYAE